MKNKKAPGHHKINNELIKYGGEVLFKTQTKLFNKILSGGEIPEEWEFSDIILTIHKKGDKHKIENYRSISLIPAMSKMFTKLLETRIIPIIE